VRGAPQLPAHGHRCWHLDPQGTFTPALTHIHSMRPPVSSAWGGMWRGWFSRESVVWRAQAIVDKNARIGMDCQIINKEGVMEANKEAEGYFIKDGIITICKDATIQAGTII
jgi:hypothetical protein